MFFESLYFYRLSRQLNHALSKGDLTYRDDKGRGLLHLCLLLGDDKTFQQLVDQGVQDHPDSYGMHACDIAQYLEAKPSCNRPLIPLVFPKNQKESRELTCDEWKKRFSVSYLDSLKFKNGYVLDWVIKKSSAKLKKNYLKSENEWSKALFLKAFLSKQVPQIEIRYIDAIIGYGIFAAEDIPQLTFIGEYTGFVRKRQRKKDQLNSYIFGYSIASSESSFVIDAKREGNFARFINHSGFPNGTSRWLIVGGVSHIIIFANQLIRKGTQLTYNYGEGYWKNRINPVDFW